MRLWPAFGIALPSPRRLQATSARDSQTRPVRKIAGMQHWRGPPGRPEQPCPPHSPHVALQQTWRLGCWTPAVQSANRVPPDRRARSRSSAAAACRTTVRVEPELWPAWFVSRLNCSSVARAHEQLYAERPGGYPHRTVLEAQRKWPRQLRTHMLRLAASHPKLRPSSHRATLACLTSFRTVRHVAPCRRRIWYPLYRSYGPL